MKLVQEVEHQLSTDIIEDDCHDAVLVVLFHPNNLTRAEEDHKRGTSAQSKKEQDGGARVHVRGPCSSLYRQSQRKKSMSS
jgi:hypothetical protein